MQIIVSVVAVAMMFLMYFIFKMRTVEIENGYKTRIRELEAEIDELKKELAVED